MKIAHFTDTFLPKMDGVVTSLISLAREQARSKNKVIILAPSQKGKLIGKEKLHKNLTVIYMPSIGANFFYPDARICLPGLPKSLYEVVRFQPDVIHFHTPLTLGMDAIISSKILRKPLIGTFHTFISDPAIMKYTKIQATPLTVKLTWKYNNFFYNACDMITAPSIKAIKELNKNGLRRKISLITNSIELARFQKPKYSRSFFIKKYQLKKNVIAYWGRIGQEKSVNLLLKSFALVLKNNPEISLLIIGDGPNLTSLKSLARTLGIMKNVIFTGEIKNKELVSSGIINVSEIFVSMSKTENQSVTTLEAMACGLPIICVEQEDIIEGNGYSLVADDYKAMASKIIYLLDNTEKRLSMGKKSRDLINNYESSVVAKQFQDLYHLAIKNKFDK